ncbi:MAG: M1 family aminopeptidase [Bacteroidales bacterium]
MAAISNYAHFQEIFSGTGGESFPLDYYVFEDDLSGSQQGVQEMPEVIQFFSDVFGTYPFSDEKYGMTQLGYYGAIENQTNTITNNMLPSWFDVSVHELGHMWFGDMITCADWHHGWLNEGFATYSEALWEEHKNGWAAYQSNMAANQFWNSGTLYLENAQDTFNIFQSIIYQKGAYALHMLRGVVGDEAFFETLLNYAQNPDYMYKNATTEDLQETFENVSGLNLDYFFEQWIYDEYYPFYHYNYAQTSGNVLYASIYQAQEEIYGYRPVFKMPVNLKFTFLNGGDTTVTVWNDEQSQQFSFEFEDEVTEMELDPEKWILRKEVFNPNIPVGIENNTDDHSIEVYPNPYLEKIYIKVPPVYNGENILLSLYSANGTLIVEEPIKEGVLNTAGLPSGSHYYVIKISGNEITSGKLIKMGK